jgi:hypothetical protein
MHVPVRLAGAHKSNPFTTVFDEPRIGGET